MKFGSWQVTENTIEWTGQSPQRFEIERQALLETVKVQDISEALYKWIVLATDEDWLNVDELYDFNFAFIYAAGAWQINLDYELFDKTVEYQYDLLDDEEGEPE